MDDLNRRAFLRRAGFAFAGVVGAASFAAAQQQEEEKKEDEETQEEIDYDALFAEWMPGTRTPGPVRSAGLSCTGRAAPGPARTAATATSSSSS